MTANPGVSKTLITSRLQKKLMDHGKLYRHGQKQVARLLVGSIKRYQFQKGNSYRIFQQ